MRFLATGLLAASLALAGTAQAQQKPGELTVAMTQFPSTLNPHIDSMLAKTIVLHMTQRPLTTYDEKWQAICLLCTELPTIENGKAVPVDLPEGKKGVKVTYTIHPKATWGDGTPVTTKDVLFTYEVGKNPDTGVANMEQFREIVGIEVKDDKTFTVTKDKLKFTYNLMNDFRLLPAHIESANFNPAQAAEYKKRTAFDTATTNPGLFFGPYKIAEIVTSSHVAFEPNPTWFGEPAKFKRIVFKVIENTAAMEANLLSGSVDYIMGELGITIDQGIAFQKRNPDKYNYDFKPGLVYEHIDLNLDNPLLKDKRVRQALLLAINRDQIVQQLFEGKQPVAHTNINPLDWIYDKDVKTYRTDQKKAAELLDAAGFNVMKEGYRHNAAGDRLRFELMTTAGNRSRELVQQVLQSQWKSVGVEIVIKNEPARVFFGETTKERKYTGMALFAWISSPENVPLTILSSKHIPTKENNWAGQNYTGYKNPEMDTLLEAIEVELDKGKRLALWTKFQAIYAEDLPVLPLFFRAEPFIVPKWLKGIVPTGHQYGTTMWSQNWAAN
ncbi:MAG: peptide ABC transporter substrate-binding protein [Alphaproteobacteria bacterium]|nr:peptide ABC transporter substrate-binding protein [Alphaproteobacteria bacterium]